MSKLNNYLWEDIFNHLGFPKDILKMRLISREFNFSILHHFSKSKWAKEQEKKMDLKSPHQLVRPLRIQIRKNLKIVKQVRKSKTGNMQPYEERLIIHNRVMVWAYNLHRILIGK